MKKQSEQKPDPVAQEAEQRSLGLLGEFWYFLKHNKKWWLTPIILVLLLAGLLVVLSFSPYAPFIYPGL